MTTPTLTFLTPDQAGATLAKRCQVPGFGRKRADSAPNCAETAPKSHPLSNRSKPAVIVCA